MHYLENYFTVGPANSTLCANNVLIIVRVASDLGIPLAPDKLEGPTTSLVFLGITIDTTRMETSLPANKLCGLLVELQSLSSRKKCQKWELLSLIFLRVILFLLVACFCIASASPSSYHLEPGSPSRLPGGSSFFPPGMAVPLFVTPSGPNQQTWNCSPTLLGPWVMASIELVTKLLTPGLPYCETTPSNGRSSTPLLLLVFCGATSGLGRNSSSTVTTSQ